MAAKYSRYASVLVDLSIDRPLDYGIPDNLLHEVTQGSVVEVPVRRKPCTGYVIAIKDCSEVASVQPIHRLISDVAISHELFQLGLWISKYYCASLRSVLRIMMPASVRNETQVKQQYVVSRLKSREELRDLCVAIREKSPPQAAVIEVMLNVTKNILLSELLEKTAGSKSPVDTLVKKGMLALNLVRLDASPLADAEFIRTYPKKLNPEQATAYSKIEGSLNKRAFATHLLYGVTGSGKTEVYLQAIERALALGRGTIMLVPEIALTTQTIERFRSRFENKIAVLHHRLSHGERSEEWHRIRRGNARIVVGARSAVFSPVSDLGLLIVDEEHDTSYKQGDESPCYHARDVAVMRAKLTNSTVILGSATPSFESFNNARQGKYVLSSLSIRADSAQIPPVTIVDMRHEYEKAKGFTTFSEVLLNAIDKRRSKGEQTILFLNRRGYHSSLMCKSCQQAVQCPHCDVSLTFHRSDNALACHLCDYTLSPPPSQCPKCRSAETFKFKGVGTEQVERALNAILSDIRTLRIDADTTKHKGSHEKLFRAFRTGKADVLIGTQMIAKGLHFPEVTLVGILNSDAALNIPDFRASETAFQLMTQVAGRAGRGALCGEVIIQTCMPDNSTVQFAAKQDFDGFFADETASRQAFLYPPFTRMAKIRVSGPDPRKAQEITEAIRCELMRGVGNTFEWQPVVPSGHAKIKDRYQFQFLARGNNISLFGREAAALQQRFALERGYRLLIDIDPVHTFF